MWSIPEVVDLQWQVEGLTILQDKYPTVRMQWVGEERWGYVSNPRVGTARRSSPYARGCAPA